MADEENKIVKFKHLSMPLKVLVVLTWILIGLYGLMFLVGFIIGLTTTI